MTQQTLPWVSTQEKEVSMFTLRPIQEGSERLHPSRRQTGLTHTPFSSRSGVRTVKWDSAVEKDRPRVQAPVLRNHRKRKKPGAEENVEHDPLDTS